MLFPSIISNEEQDGSKTMSLPQSEVDDDTAVFQKRKYKTKLCHSYNKYESCKYGDQCNFAHGEHELRGIDRHKSYLCGNYHGIGFCMFGKECSYMHDMKHNRILQTTSVGAGVLDNLNGGQKYNLSTVFQFPQPSGPSVTYNQLSMDCAENMILPENVVQLRESDNFCLVCTSENVHLGGGKNWRRLPVFKRFTGD